jgi:hypothetical protein
MPMIKDRRNHLLLHLLKEVDADVSAELAHPLSPLVQRHYRIPTSMSKLDADSYHVSENPTTVWPFLYNPLPNLKAYARVFF